MEIEPKYVTFEQAKWLKEKGFDVQCRNRLTSLIDSTGKYETPQNFNKYLNAVSLPEQWQVVEFLRLNHGIWVEVTIYRKDNRNYMQYSIFYFPSMDSRVIIRKDDYRRLDEFNSPQEAYSAAFDYIKDNNLI
jgi:hypothetical protein